MRATVKRAIALAVTIIQKVMLRMTVMEIADRVHAIVLLSLLLHYPTKLL
ncbi:hypothetical protein [Arachidicoccus soli]|nr:hypothetical protein [Arachidicoccus soli]